jgi:mannosyltransferase OCH1-like enzyme
MSIAWDEVWDEALTAAVDAAKAKAPAARDYIRRIAEARARRVELLVIAWAAGDLEEETLQAELDEERDLLRAEFLAIQVLTKKAAQDAANALFDVIESALLAGIEVVL